MLPRLSLPCARCVTVRFLGPRGWALRPGGDGGSVATRIRQVPDFACGPSGLRSRSARHACARRRSQIDAAASLHAWRVPRFAPSGVSQGGRAPMDPHYAEFVGVAAAGASLYAAHSKTIIPLRVAAIVANVLAMTYSLMHGTYPTFMLNAVLLPLNGWRLRAMLGLIHDIDTATKGDM